jgi:AhpD family alkylhydroperoxidase
MIILDNKKNQHFHVTNDNDILTKYDSDFYNPFDKLYDLTWGDGFIPSKFKHLIGVTSSVMIRCEPCLNYHIKMCIDQGGTKEEIIEALRIGVLSGGSGGVPTARMGFQLLQNMGKL